MVIGQARGWAPFVVSLLVNPLGSQAIAAPLCDRETRSAPAATGADQSFSAADLVALRDIGNPDSSRLGSPSPLAVDPTGRKVAFVQTAADPIRNTHCRRLLQIDLFKGGKVTELDEGGDFIGDRVDRAGVMIASGTPSLIVPQWSPDGVNIAYLRQDGGVTQLWIVSADGQNAYPATASDRDVVAFRWQDHDRLVFSTKAAEAEPHHEIGNGYLYDRRFVPTTSALPQPSASDDYEFFRYILANKSIEPLGQSAGTAALSREPQASAWRGASTPLTPSPLGPSRIVAFGRGEKAKHCMAGPCTGRFTGVWESGQQVIFMRREGPAADRLALYSWSPEGDALRRILATDDTLIGCTPAMAMLVCLREHATRTRHLVRINLASGAVREIYDPNPQTRHWRFGSVQRLYWKNSFGLQAYGDLVLPPGNLPDKPLPLVVVQYNSVGFLRGGTGDEYPIHLLAQHGFAVLSIQRPPFVAALRPELTTAEEINAFNLDGWAERRSLHSSLETGIRQVVARGLVDPARIGITGLSDGATTARFALINSSLFAAAAVSSCCIDPGNLMTLNGPSYAAFARKIGYPPLTEPDGEFWKPVSLAMNAADVGAPLLMQLSDDEYLVALDSYAALREHAQPVEMHVFPDEHHIKTQPAHRLAIYRRSIQWFAFWLQDRELPEPLDPEQYGRWRDLREARALPPNAATPR